MSHLSELSGKVARTHKVKCLFWPVIVLISQSTCHMAGACMRAKRQKSQDRAVSWHCIDITSHVPT